MRLALYNDFAYLPACLLAYTVNPLACLPACLLIGGHPLFKVNSHYLCLKRNAYVQFVIRIENNFNRIGCALGRLWCVFVLKAFKIVESNKPPRELIPAADEKNGRCGI